MINGSKLPCFAVVLIALSIAVTAAAEPTCPPTVAAPTPQQLYASLRDAKDRGVLWSIEKDGRESWLYGTIHLGNLETAMPGPKLRAALRSADVIALELNLTDSATIEALQAPDGGIDAPAIPSALIERLKARAEKACVSWDTLSAMPPTLVVAGLTVLEARWDGLDPSYGTELVLSGLARAANKPIVPLESVEVHRRALMGGSPERRIAVLEGGLTALEQGRVRPLARMLAKAWQDGDLERIADYEQWCGCVSTPEAKAQFARTVIDRNPDLAAGIDAIHREGKRVFAAAGILHMVGDRSLPALLEKLGYTVNRVQFDNAASSTNPGSERAADPGPPGDPAF